MTSQEIHIALDLELQKINSFNTKSLEAPEKDYFLNNEALKFIKQRTNPQSNAKGTGFQDTVKRVDDIQELVKSLKSQIEVNNQGESYVTLPSDYLGYVVSSLYMKKECIDERIKKEAYNTYSIFSSLNIPEIKPEVYTIKITIEGVETILFNLDMLPENYLSNTLQFVRQDFVLIDALKIIIPRELKKNNISYSQLYWERRGNEFNPYSFTLNVLGVDSFITITVNDEVNVYSVTTTSISSVPLRRFPLKAKLRLINEEFLPDVKRSGLSGSTPNSPISVLREGQLLVEIPNSVIADWVEMVYICKPTPINLLLNSSFNLNENNIREIIGNTARYIKAVISDPNYQAYAQENLIIE